MCCSYCEGSHKKPAEPVEPVVSDTISSQSQSSFAIVTSYSDHVSTSSFMLTTDGLTQSGTQSGTESGAQPNIMDDVMATMSSSAQESNQIEVPMSLNSRITFKWLHLYFKATYWSGFLQVHSLSYVYSVVCSNIVITRKSQQIHSYGLIPIILLLRFVICNILFVYLKITF